MASTGSSSSGATDAAANASVVVGVLCCQHPPAAEWVTANAREGLALYFAGAPQRVVVVDTASSEGEARPADYLEMPYHGVPGKARALQTILGEARDGGARVCVLLDGRVASVTPRWIEWLARPVLDHEFDYVSPFYDRHPFEGALTKAIVYPLVRALYGVQLRQPAAAEFACSARLIEHFLDEDLWERDGAQVGIDLWLTTSAASGDFRLGEAALGVRTHQARGDDALDLATTIGQVVGSVFTDMERRAARWQRVRGSVPVPRFGSAPAAPPHAPSVDLDRLIESFRLGYRELRDIWTWVLPPRTIVDLRRLVDAPAAQFRLDDALWARIVYDFALGHRLRVLARTHLMGSLVPLYLGWLASFILQVRESGADAVDARVEELALAFEAQKPYLIARWRWPERLRTG